jgi:hypothetical protein
LVAGDAFIFLRYMGHFLAICSAPLSWFGLILVNSNKYIIRIICRGENGELRVGVRRHMRQVNNMPSSVISSHSMHLGVLATASHAISTGTLFSVFYKPR